MDPDSIKWLDAIKSMIYPMYENQVWNLVDPPEGMMPIECRWIYKERDMDVYIHKMLNLSKGVYDKVQKVDCNKVGSLVVMLVYRDYFSNHCIFYL
jgi:hypothetical protein